MSGLFRIQNFFLLPSVFGLNLTDLIKKQVFAVANTAKISIQVLVVIIVVQAETSLLQVSVLVYQGSTEPRDIIIEDTLLIHLLLLHRIFTLSCSQFGNVPLHFLPSLGRIVHLKLIGSCLPLTLDLILHVILSLLILVT